MSENKPKTKTNLYDAISRSMLIVLAAVACFGGVWRMVSGDEKVLGRLNKDTLFYFVIAGALLLLREVKSLAFGDYKVEFERVKTIAEDAQSTAKEAQVTARNAQAETVGAGGPPPKAEQKASLVSVPEPEEGGDKDDPWKGQFGGQRINNGRELSAVVRAIPGSTSIYSIRLLVRSLNPDSNPLQGVLRFFLHPTFKNNKPIVKVGPTGNAELNLRAWGAFTVGALADDGLTKLELDLASLEDAPLSFRQL